MSSSISASDRGNQTDELRRMREEYEQKKAEDAKKQKRDLVRMQEKHDIEMDELRGSYEGAIGEMREKNREVLTERDQKNIKNIDDLRKMHVEQLRRKSLESDEARRAIDESYRSQLAKEKRIAAGQRETMKQDFGDSIKERDRNFQEFVTDANDKVKEALTTRSQKLNDKHQEEMKYVREERDDSVAELINAKESQTGELRNELKDIKRKYSAEDARKEENWMRNYRNQEARNDAILSSKNAEMTEHRKWMVNDFADKISDKQASIDRNWEGLRASVEDRMSSQVNRLKSDLVGAKTDKTLERITNNRLKNIERNNLIKDYEKRMKIMEEERGLMLDKAHEIVKDRVENVIDRTEKLVQNTNRNNKMSQNVILERGREERAQLVNNFENAMDHTKSQSEVRVKRLVDASHEAQKVQMKSHEANLDQLRTNYSENLQAQREVQQGILKDVQSHMERKLRENDVKHNQKMEKIVDNYEQKLELLDEQRQADLKKLQDAQAMKDKQKDKDFRMQQEALIAKYETKIGGNEEEHRKEIERLERRHNEQMAALSVRLGAYNKKA